MPNTLETGWNTPKDFQMEDTVPTAQLTPSEQDILLEAQDLLKAGKTLPARRKLHPVLERICEEALDTPQELDDLYAHILLTEEIQREEKKVGLS